MNVNPENRLLAKSLALEIRKSRTDNRVLRNLLKLHLKAYGKDKTRNIAIRGFEMSFIPPGKDVVLSEKGRWKRDNRQAGKPGRVLRRVMKENLPEETYQDAEIEEAVNILKALSIDGTFEEVTGKAIGDWYRGKRATNTGTLGHSCMNGASNEQTAFYDSNPEAIKLVIFLDKAGRLKGRALLWGNKYMDRVYGSDDTRKLFHAYAREKKYTYKKDQGYGSGTWVHPDGKETKSQWWVDLKKVRFGRLPHLDTFSHIDTAQKTVSNKSGKRPKSLKSKILAGK